MGANKSAANRWSWHVIVVGLAFTLVLGYLVFLLTAVFQPAQLCPPAGAGPGADSASVIASMPAGAPASQGSASGPACDHGKWGQLGDSFGGVTNSLISLLVLVYAMNAFRTQKDELRFTGQLLAKQFRSAEQQERRRTFFDLVAMHGRILADLQAPGGGDQRGRAAIAAHFSLSLTHLQGPQRVAWLVSQFTTNPEWLSSYLRSASIILSFIGESLSDWDRSGDQGGGASGQVADSTLKSMFAAQFGEAELNLFSALALSDDKKFKPMLLEPLRKSRLLDGLDDTDLQRALSNIGLGRLSNRGA